MKRNYTILAALILMVISAVGSANAQTSSINISIPFDFVVENQTLPAGEYNIQPAVGGRIMLRSHDGATATTVLTLPVKSQQPSSETKLVFKRYGNQYFLAQVWSRGANVGREVLAGRSEQEAAKNKSSERLTVLASKRK
jgi:hypothetical protein